MQPLITISNVEHRGSGIYTLDIASVPPFNFPTVNVVFSRRLGEAVLLTKDAYPADWPDAIRSAFVRHQAEQLVTARESEQPAA